LKMDKSLELKSTLTVYKLHFAIVTVECYNALLGGVTIVKSNISELNSSSD